MSQSPQRNIPDAGPNDDQSQGQESPAPQDEPTPSERFGSISSDETLVPDSNQPPTRDLGGLGRQPSPPARVDEETQTIAQVDNGTQTSESHGENRSHEIPDDRSARTTRVSGLHRSLFPVSNCPSLTHSRRLAPRPQPDQRLAIERLVQSYNIPAASSPASQPATYTQDSSHGLTPTDRHPLFQQPTSFLTPAGAPNTFGQEHGHAPIPSRHLPPAGTLQANTRNLPTPTQSQRPPNADSSSGPSGPPNSFEDAAEGKKDQDQGGPPAH